MILQLILAFAAAAILSLIMTPVVAKIAVRLGAVDQPNARRMHNSPKPRLGGVAVFASFFLSIFIVLNFASPLDNATWITGPKGMAFAGTLLLVLFLGIWDDLRQLKPSQKFLVQVFLGLIAYGAGFKISVITHPFSPGAVEIGFLDLPATLIWIVGITNAINLIDGLDGLASGVGIMAGITIASISLIGGDVGTAIVAVGLAGALLGFLPYNFNPASIFLGDAGSLFLGFSLALLSMEGGARASTAFAIVVPILALGFPIVDTFLAMLRRFLSSFLTSAPAPKSFSSRLRSMFLPDRRHIHHRLIARGLSHRDAVLVLYAVSCALGVLAFVITVSNSTLAALILLAVGSLSVVGIRLLKYQEMSILKAGVLLPLYERPILGRESFQFFVDMGFCVLAFVAAFFIDGTASLSGKQFYFSLLMTGFLQVGVFFIAGLHLRTIGHFGLGDGLTIIKGVAAAVVVSALCVTLVSSVDSSGFQGLPLSTHVLDFYILLSFVLGSRVSSSILRYLSTRKVEDRKRALIYGANLNSVIVLEQLKDSDLGEINPIGFLDENPDLEGKHLHGYPIFGGHWKLQRLARTMNVEEVLLCTTDLTLEVQKRLKRIASECSLRIRTPRFTLEDFHVATQTQIGFSFLESPVTMTAPPQTDPQVVPISNKGRGL